MSRAFFTENAFNILGLDSDASEKEILKRSREIGNLIKIDETPEYKLDLPFSKDVRTESKVKKAAEKLITPDKKIVETFFWFFVRDNIDEKALKSFRDGDFLSALKILQNKIEKTPNNFSGLRNKAVLESLIFSDKAQNKYLEASLKSWQLILDSEKQWSDFEKVYRLNNPDVGDTLFKSFKKDAKKLLSSFYESMSRAENKPEIYAAFSKCFSTHSDSFDREILDPLLNKLNDLTKKTKRYDIEFNNPSYKEENKCLSKNSEKIIKKLKNETDKITDQIQALGENIWDSSKVIVERDKNAMALRSIAIEIANNSNFLKYPNDKKLLDELLLSAYEICSKDSIVEKRIEKDQEDSEEIDAALRKIKKNNDSVKIVKKKVDKAMELIRDRDYNGAITIIDKCLKYKLGAEDRAFLKDLRADCIAAAKQKEKNTIFSIIWWSIIGFLLFLSLISSASR